MAGFKIGEGQKYDTTQVSQDGVTREESTKDKKKLNQIFDIFDKDKNGILDSKELADMVSVFNAYDKDNDKKLERKEFKALADTLNAYLPYGDDLSGKDIRNFFKKIMSAQKDDEKISVTEVRTQEILEIEPPKVEAVPVARTGHVEDAPQGVTPPAEHPEEKQELHSYTVQEGERYTDLIIRSLKAQGIENPTEEQIKEAKENFEKNNPGAVKRTKKGYEYLLVGAKVQLEGQLEDKNNAREQINQYIEKHVKPLENGNRGVQHAEPDPEVVQKAKEKDYRATFSPDYFYDEETKKHYQYDKEKGEFVEAENVVYVGEDGSYRKTIPNDDGTAKSITYDKDGNITTMKALAQDRSMCYSESDDAAKKLGLRETFATKSKGVYYDEQSQTHFKWNDETHTFEAMDKDVAMVGKDGTIYDENGRHDNWQLKTDGTDVYTDPETGNTETYTYDENGNTTKCVNRDKDGNVTCTTEFTYDENNKETYRIDKYPDGSINEFWTDENGNIKNVLKNADGNVVWIYSETRGKDGSYISQQVDAQGNIIGEPAYYDKDNNTLTKEQYEALQK